MVVLMGSKSGNIYRVNEKTQKAIRFINNGQGIKEDFSEEKENFSAKEMLTFEELEKMEKQLESVTKKVNEVITAISI